MRSVFLLLAIFLSTNAYAIDAPYTKFVVNGKEYNVPIPNKEAKSEFYFVHKALDGDKTARDLLLGGTKERMIFIGDADAVRWLVIWPDGEKVLEYPIK